MSTTFGLPLPWLSNPKFSPPGSTMAPIPPVKPLRPAPKPAVLNPDPIPLYRVIDVLKPIALRDIAEEVRVKHNLTPMNWASRRRFKYLVFARQEYFYRAMHETNRSTYQIGLAIGGFDHSTVMSGAKAHEARMKAEG